MSVAAYSFVVSVNFGPWNATTSQGSVGVSHATLVKTVTRLQQSGLVTSRPYRAKLAPYESGSPLFSDARVQFPIRYYIIAMLFVIFDIEIVFMFPWAVAFKKLGLVGLVEMIVFIGILVVGFWYAWKKGALEWD